MPTFSRLRLSLTSGDWASGDQTVAFMSADVSRTKARLVAGQVISNWPALSSRTVNGGGSTSNVGALATLPCGVTMVIGPDAVPGGTKAINCRS